MTPVRTILHPTDFSPNSRPAFELACSLARDYGARLVLLHVLSPLTIASESGTVTVEPPDTGRAAGEELEALRADLPGLRVDRFLRDGAAADEIVRLAGEVGCDLVVMGTHGRTGLRRLLMGSVAEEVARKAPCPVLTLKLPVPFAAAVPRDREPAAAKRS
jgi:nucleotide-binding universal stress UspA family protein